jgi:hypothetical protein
VDLLTEQLTTWYVTRDANNFHSSGAINLVLRAKKKLSVTNVSILFPE